MSIFKSKRKNENIGDFNQKKQNDMTFFSSKKALFPLPCVQISVSLHSKLQFNYI